MKGFTPTAESQGFSPDLLWLGLRSGCHATKSRRSRSESYFRGHHTQFLTMQIWEYTIFSWPE